ncbi:winged helix-turn-helix domain-containing protein [Leptolyngbya sp. FACHB-541]|nr:winged helix-turn-helix domain-containing protein [Leptolyngbya sp. FACHB-541]
MGVPRHKRQPVETTPPGANILKLVQSNPGLTTKAIAEKLQISQGMARKYLYRLQARRLVMTSRVIPYMWHPYPPN